MVAGTLGGPGRSRERDNSDGRQGHTCRPEVPRAGASGRDLELGRLRYLEMGRMVLRLLWKEKNYRIYRRGELRLGTVAENRGIIQVMVSILSVL